jgi:hypothetical protein
MLLRDDRRQDQDQMLQVLDGIQRARAKDSKRLSDAVPELLEAHHVRHRLGRFKHPASPKVGPGSSAGSRRPGACGRQGRRRNLLTPAGPRSRARRFTPASFSWRSVLNLRAAPHPSLSVWGNLRNRRDAYVRRRRRGYRGQRQPTARVSQLTRRANLRAKRSAAPSHSGRASASSTSAPRK